METDEVRELFTHAGRPFKINGPLVSGGMVGAFWPGNDSKTVFYAADEETLFVRDLWGAKPLVFADGFESGNLDAWAGSTP